MSQLFKLISLLLILNACSKSEKTWQVERVVQLDGIAPTGISYIDNALFVSDGDNDRLLKLDYNDFSVLSEQKITRPMHLSSMGKLLIPSYTSDSIFVLVKNEELAFYYSSESLDAPASAIQYNNALYIADFYNHQIVMIKNSLEKRFGKKGTSSEEFHYPTDLQVYQGVLFIADAYNHRILRYSLDKDGNINSPLIIGEKDKMNAAIGLFIYKEQLLVTDFENSRVLVYTVDGNLIQIIGTEFDRPIDLVNVNEKLYVINYKGQSITILE